MTKSWATLLLVACVAAGLLTAREWAREDAARAVEILYPDEIVSAVSQDDLTFLWWNNTGKYPPLAYLVLSAARTESSRPFARARLVHLVMAWASSVLVAVSVLGLCGSRAAALVAGLVHATTPTTLFNGGTFHVDVQCLFWTAAVIAACASTRAVRAAWPCALAALLACAAGLTKDPVYPLTIPLLAWFAWRARRHGRGQWLGATAGSTAGVGLGVALYAWVAPGIDGKGILDAVRAHVSWITSGGIVSYREHPASVAGWASTVVDALGQLVRFVHPITGLVVLVLVAAGTLRWLRASPDERDEAGGGAPLASLGVAAYLLLFVAPIGFCHPRFWIPIWPLLLVGAACEAARLLRGRTVAASLVALVVVSLGVAASRTTLAALREDPRTRMPQVARDLVPESGNTTAPILLPCISQELGARYAPTPSGWKEVPALRDWKRERFGLPATDRVRIVGLPAVPQVLELYRPGIVIARDEELSAESASAWGYRRALVDAPLARHPALPAPPTLSYFVRQDDADRRLEAASREHPLARDEAWLVLGRSRVELLPPSEQDDGTPFFERFGRVWREGVAGDPDALPPDFVDPAAVDFVRLVLAKGV